MNRIFFVFLITAGFISFGVNSSILAQTAEEDSVFSESPFRKGRWITGLNGRVNSASSSYHNANDFSHGYAFNLKTGYFIQNKFPIGLFLIAQRFGNKGFTQNSSESLGIGPWSRFYFSKNTNGSVFIQTSVFYARFLEKTLIDDPRIPFEEVLKGGGVGGGLGAGYSYIIKNRIGLDISFGYNITYIDGDVEDKINDTTTRKRYYKTEMSFSFGFTIFIDEFFF